MPKISKSKQDKIKEQLLSLLFQEFPKPLFTSYIAKELARDEEFIKKILVQLAEKKYVVPINKNPEGKNYSRRIRWRLSSQIYDLYKKQQ